jgi:glutamate dehydrogenase/leucine dehydrogenase
MSVNENSAVAQCLAEVVAKNPQEFEFHQAVEEVLVSIQPLLQANPIYHEARFLERLVEPERVILFRVPWIDDEGDLQINRGFRVEMNSALDPYKGGLRFHPTVTLGTLKFLAFEQVLKNSLTTLTLGGGKGGSDFDPKGKSDNEVMAFCQSFMTELYRHIGPDTDVPAGDIGVGAREIGFLFGQYKRIANRFNGVLTGKGLAYGGSLIRQEATGYGAVYFAENMLATRGDSVRAKRAVISGSGNVAQHAAEKLLELGAKPITLSDSAGTIVDEDGIDAEKLAWVKELKNVRRGRIHEYAERFKGARYLPGERPWAVPGELAFPCATQNELSGQDAENLLANGCVCLCEGANMPTEPQGVERFLKAKQLFGPGKAANAGGVAVSGLEMTQNAGVVGWPREEVDQRLQQIMHAIHDNCVQYGSDGDFVNYVQGANIAGFVKVADAMLAQGCV